ncbi:DUF1778 domain-containing protein [Methylocaldum sp. BRCS4]|nr:DUF1778 domain-containing protein [Methylocaldum sp. BRCS4]
MCQYGICTEPCWKFRGHINSIRIISVSMIETAMPTATTPYERIDLRTSPEIKALIVRAAATAGVSVSAFLLGAAQERAKQVLSEAELMTLSPRDWEAFFTALDHTDKPRPKLSAAMQRHREWQSERESS